MGNSKTRDQITNSCKFPWEFYCLFQSFSLRRIDRQRKVILSHESSKEHEANRAKKQNVKASGNTSQLITIFASLNFESNISCWRRMFQKLKFLHLRTRNSQEFRYLKSLTSLSLQKETWQPSRSLSFWLLWWKTMNNHAMTATKLIQHLFPLSTAKDKCLQNRYSWDTHGSSGWKMSVTHFPRDSCVSASWGSVFCLSFDALSYIEGPWKARSVAVSRLQDCFSLIAFGDSEGRYKRGTMITT